MSVMLRAPTADPTDEGMRRSYIRVIIAWLAALAGLYILQEYFLVR
jgi:hypothetical protein